MFSKTFVSVSLVLAMLFSVGASVVRADANTYYVNVSGGSDSNDGLAWTSAFATLQKALSVAVSGDEIWVAQGVYYPDEGPGQTDNDRTATFQLKNGVGVYGGFAGIETARDQRDPVVNITVLNGDIDGNDINTDGNFIAETWNDIQGANTYHVVTGSGTDGTAVLDGFTITAGYSSDDPLNARGAGMYNDHGSPVLTDLTFIGNWGDEGGGMSNENSSHPTLNTVTFSGNRAVNGGGLFNLNSNPTLTNVNFESNRTDFLPYGGFGGGMYNGSSNPILTNVVFHSNFAGDWGGGMVSIYSNPVLTDVTFSDNSGVSGGGMSNWDGTASLTNVTFSGNTARAYEGGGLYNSGSTVSLNNVTFRGNHAGNAGGGIYHHDGILVITQVLFSANSAVGNGGGIVSDGGNLTLTNVTFSTNSAGDGGGGMANANNSPVLSNILMWGNTALNGGGIWNIANSTSHISYSDIQGCNPGGVWNSACGTDGGGNLPDADPLFVDPANGDLHLQPGSPAIDKGTNTGCPATDLDGVPRPQGNACDIGAYETTLETGPAFIVNVSDDTDDGSCDYYVSGLYDCTLREAINAANMISGTDTITFAANYTITLVGSQLPAVTSTILINGNGAANTIIQANAAPNTATYRVFEVGDTGDLTLNSLTARNGRCSDSCATVPDVGGGIYNIGPLTMTNVTVSGNSAAAGGGIYNDGPVTMTNSTLSGNSVSQRGGGIFNDGYALTVTNSTLSGNSASDIGGGIFNYGTVTVTNSTLSDNSANGGGGIFNYGIVTVTNSTLSGNSASGGGGGIVNGYGMVTVTNSTLSGNSSINNNGGGIYNVDTLIVTNSTFSDNSANSGRGGGIYGAWPSYLITITNSTFSDNSASDSGGGIYFLGHAGSTFNLVNTILANSPAGGDCVNDSPVGVVDINNLIESHTGCGAPISSDDPGLAPLQNNGGTTQTFALLPGSPGIDAGDNTSCPATDQRGETRSIPNCDIGAFESQGFSLIVTGGNNQNALINRAFTNPLVVGVTANNAVEPVNGGLVTFTAPVSGASAVLTGSPTTILSGSASVTATANDTSGAYQVSASASGASTDVNFKLTNTIILIFRSVGAYDGWILESGENTTLGGTLDSTATTFNLGDGAADKQYRAVLSFNTATLPDNAVITKVTLRIRKQAPVGTDPFTILGGLKVDMRKPYFGTALGLAVHDFQVAAGKTAVATFNATPVSGWYSALLSAIGRDNVNKTGTTQFRLYFRTDDNNDNGADYMKFFSGNYATVTARPTLIIEYYVP